MTKRYNKGIWWIKRDFRLRDNDALCNALTHCNSVLPLFIIEPALCAAPETSYLHYHAWHQAMSHLQESIKVLGGSSLIQVAEPVSLFEFLHSKDGFDALFSHEETGSDITFQRDLAVKHWCQQHNIAWHEYAQNGVVRGLANRDERQQVIKQRLMQTTPLPAPNTIKSWLPQTLHSTAQWPSFADIAGKPINPGIQIQALQTVTETAAHECWNSFLQERGIKYAGGISSPNTAFSAGSRLSTHLAWGTISLRQVFHDTWDRQKQLSQRSDPSSVRWNKSLTAFQSRLHWHDHFMQRLESAPSMEFEAINPAYRKLKYGDNDTLMHAWETGNTGIVLADACLRCLAATGFINFRMRAMLVSLGCYGLAQSWQALQYPLARMFLDYEPGIHFSQVQMQAGIVGINTIRIYNPHKQLLDQDPDAQFVKRWIPELREFSALEIAAYNERDLGDYPAPVTDIDANTCVIRDQVYAIRKSDEGKLASATVLNKHGSRRRRSSMPSKRVNKQADRQLGFDFDA